jgi:DNA-binding protein HU-beta
MTKFELIERLAVRMDFTKRDTAKLLDATFDEIATVVKKTGRFAWPGFGIWSLRTRVARNVSNPSTKEIMRLPKSKTVGFRPARELKARL